MPGDDAWSEPAERGRFVVLDGIDGCGKSTQASRLVAAWSSAGATEEPLHLREPGSTRAGERIRSLLLEPGTEIGAAAEALLFAAARRQMLDERVAPALERGRDVVCERFHAATYAYQAVAGGLDGEALLELLTTWAGRPEPDLVVLLDLPAEDAAARLARGDRPDRIEARGIDYQRRVAEGFRKFAERGSRVTIVDARGPADDVAGRVLAEVRRALG